MKQCIYSFLSELQDLPKTSYFKLIDFWLLFNVTVLAFIMVCHTYVGRILNTEPSPTLVKPMTPGPHKWPFALPTSKQDRPDKQDVVAQAKKANRLGIILIACLSVLFNMVFWFYGIQEYLRPAESYFDQ